MPGSLTSNALPPIPDGPARGLTRRSWIDLYSTEPSPERIRNMLVLARKQEQRIIINGGEIIITVVRIANTDHVRLGFEAAPHISIHREEVWKQIVAQNEERNRQAVIPIMSVDSPPATPTDFRLTLPPKKD
jgi:carbon storage regulator